MTIFIEALKALIWDKLSALSNNLNIQATTKYLGFYQPHNVDLSIAQKEKIDSLMKLVNNFNATNNDLNDMKSIVELLKQTLDKIQKVRTKFQASQDSSNTVDCLTKLTLHAEQYYKKLNELTSLAEKEDMKFDLLDKPHDPEIPEGILYFHMACYFGDEIFNPASNMNIEIRKKKEMSIVTRIADLVLILQSERDVKARTKLTLRTLADLIKDNSDAISGEKKNKSPLSLISIYGISINTASSFFNGSGGRLATKLKLVVDNVADLVESCDKSQVIRPEKIEKKEEVVHQSVDKHEEEHPETESSFSNH